MIALRETVRALIDAQLSDESDEVVTALQAKLNGQYDTFTKKYGLINSRANETVFSDDSSYFLLSSLEVVNEDKELIRKADMFVKRTIKPYTKIDRVDTASEALAVSLSERAAVDMDFMSELTGKSEEELFADLHGVIFLNTKESVLTRQPKYLTADEYLSGNVREKLADARKAKEAFGEPYVENIAALEAVQPQDLTAAEIGVKLGSTWVPDEVVQEFVFGLLDTPKWAQWNIGVKYIPTTAQWIVTNKSYDRGNVKASTVYGTGRINAYSIIEETLNLKDVRIFDYVEDENGNKKPVLNKKAPTLKDFYEELKAQPEPEAKDIALSLELFTSGSLDTFANETNVDTKNRLICYDIHDLGRALMPIGMLVVLDNILNRITANKARGRKTYIFIDEIYLLLLL